MHILNLCLFWLFFGFLCSYLAKRKERNQRVWFILGLLLGLIGVGILALLPRKAPPRVRGIPSPVSPPKEVTPLACWYYLDHLREAQGPISQDELEKKRESQQFSENTYVWKEGMKEWKKLRELMVESSTNSP